MERVDLSIKEERIPKIIWTYREQGFGNFLLIVQNYIQSWRKWNPIWDIKLLDKNSLLRPGRFRQKAVEQIDFFKWLLSKNKILGYIPV
ncbi:hypothetical protein WCX18_11530 [Sulfurimonas sp. HSL1-2]|uniref:hypothetical protein n=1 Tax=Thiomicrolovo zhangzhouensis TaxID=3131933 RepID=UPI0031F79CB8